MNIPKLRALCDYPKMELMKQICEVLGLLNTLYDVEYDEDTVTVEGTEYNNDDFLDRIYYCAAHAIYNRGGIEIRAFFQTVNPVFQPDLNNNRSLLTEASAYLEISSSYVDVCLTSLTGQNFNAALPKGAYHLITIAGNGDLHMLEGENCIQLGSSLPDLNAIRAYYSWYKMEERS